MAPAGFARDAAAHQIRDEGSGTRPEEAPSRTYQGQDREFTRVSSHTGRQGAVTGLDRIRAVIVDVDGTLVDSEKRLTKRTIEVVHELQAHDIEVMLTSGRPPRGMMMLVDPLNLTMPLAAFNGGMFVDPDMTTLDRHLLVDELIGPLCAILSDSGLDVWSYTESDWYVREIGFPHVARETATVGFRPVVRHDIENLRRVVKLVGVSDDDSSIARAAVSIQQAFGNQVAANTSQPYYLDITHPSANKGTVVRFLSERLGIDPGQIAAIGDMPNDILMFEAAGFAIAMGNGEDVVKEHADVVTATNDENGFAEAMDRYVLGRWRLDDEDQPCAD